MRRIDAHNLSMVGWAPDDDQRQRPSLPAIVCGDFNGDGRSAACELLLQSSSDKKKRQKKSPKKARRVTDRGYTVRLSPEQARSVFAPHDWAFESAYDAQGTAADSAATTTVTSARSGRMRSNDHIFFTPGSLALRALRATAAEWNDDGDEPNYPNEEHPSDHLPIAAAFDFIC